MHRDYTNLGFKTVSVDSLAEYRADAIHLTHIQTGADIYKITADDEENMFAFAFRTPPSDHTGVPHILEHAVLCGSESYPLKDPFLVLLKGSAHTFLNAMTYPDKTVYPAASTIKADFLNLLRVYGDAVFFPQLKKEAFLQEGHHLEYDEEGRLVRGGIVLNEMKGSYSSPESVAGDWALRSIFPDSPYRWDSGGDPEHIPSLSYDDFKKFHERWYHPSNVRIFLYGDHDLGEVLRILDTEFLSRFSRREIPSEIPLQPRWRKPCRTEAFWPSAPGEPTEHKTTISINWLLGESTDPIEALSAQVLSFILLGHGGSPLQKAIIDSGIGEDLSPVSGIETELRQMVFTAAVRGTDPERREDFEALVDGTLRRLVSEGLDTQLVEGALRTVEFRSREIRGGTPFGIRLMKRALRGWLHDRPPVESLAFESTMKQLRERNRPGYFESLIRHQLLENPHRSTVSVVPDPQLQSHRDAQERRILDEVKTVMEKSGSHKGLSLESLESSLRRLEEFQETPDSPEELAKIPFLTRSELPGDVMSIPLSAGSREGIQWYRHDTFANGVVYLEAAFNLDGLDAELFSWLPLFGRSLTDVGLPGRGHDEVARDLALKTGGLGTSLEASPVHPQAGGGLSRRLFIHLKALADQWDEALEITREIIVSADFDDVDRVGDLLLELRNDHRSAVVPSGHAFAALRASTKHSPSASWDELWYGIDQLKFLQDATQRPEGKAAAAKALKTIRDTLLRRDNLTFTVTGDSKNSQAALEKVLTMASGLPAGGPSGGGEPVLFRHPSVGESLTTASAVSFSALSLPSSLLGTPQHARRELLAHILKTGFLWENIRMKGGAYGALASVSGMEQTFTFSTYRDPQINPSLEAFRKALEWASTELDDEIVDMAIIGCIGRELRPMGPGEKGAVAFKRQLYGISDDIRQRRRSVQLKASAEELRGEARALLECWDNRSVSVIAGAEALKEAVMVSSELGESWIDLPS